MDGGDTTTEFTLEISVFKDQDYSDPYGIRDFPLKVTLNKPLFVQVTTLARCMTLFKGNVDILEEFQFSVVKATNTIALANHSKHVQANHGCFYFFFVLLLIGWEIGASVQSEIDLNQSKPKLISTLNWKPVEEPWKIFQ